eukprot:GGOE01023080.1.p1 GENE.GGOE01023080.1~~GGOE01023080.1.p1  ORF type:complete len:249 (-),score=53.64 GGOE01023080.1:295-1041(-)
MMGKAAAADVLCLQEFWFDEELSDVYQSTLGPRYDFIGMQRTGFKTDGLMLLVDRQKYSVLQTYPLVFEGEGERVALFVSLRDCQRGSKLIVGTTHLTFPHTKSDVQLAQDQAARLLQHADDLQQRLKAPVIVAGDFNSGPESQVYRAMMERGYVDTWLACHQHRQLGIHTHFNHRGQKVCVDYIFLRNPDYDDHVTSPLQTTACTLLPEHLRPERWPSPQQYDMSDHRPMVADFGPDQPRPHPHVPP